MQCQRIGPAGRPRPVKPILAVLVVTATVLAGCVGGQGATHDDPLDASRSGDTDAARAANQHPDAGTTDPHATGSAAEASSEPGFDPESPSTFSFTERECFAMNVMIHLPRDQLQEWLPEGFVAETFEDTYARGLDVHEQVAATGDAAETPMGAIWPEVHACRGDDGIMRGSAWIWAAIEAPAGYDHLQPSGFDAYEICYSGYDSGHTGEHAAIVDARIDLGFTMCGDIMTMTEPTKETIGWQWSAEMTEYGAPHWAMTMEHSTEASHTVDGLYRIWHQTANGTAHMDYVHIVDDTPASPIHFSATFECSMAPGSIPAKLIGYTSCADAIAAGTFIFGIFLPPHHMDVTFVYEPFEG